jgi:trigger factor
MRSTAEVLEGNRVKLSVEIDEDELRSAVDDTVKKLQREVRVPGFRPGKVPRRLLEVRLGGKAIREEVIRHSLPEYYAQAVEEAALDTISAPEIDITSGEEEGPLAFDAVVEVRPKVSIAGYEGLQVTVPSPLATDEEIDSQINRMREQFAELTDVDRPARDDDVVTVDVTGLRDGEPVEDLSTSDYVYQLGTGMIAEGADEALRGAKAGDIVDVDAAHAPSGPATLRILVKKVQEKVLPDADDEWASDASEFETLAELREDLSKRLTALKRLQAQLALREEAVAALAGLVSEEMPETLVNSELERLQASFVRRITERRIALEQYLEATNQTVEQLVEELRGQAVTQVRADLALRALAEAQELTATDEDLAAEIGRVAEDSGQPVREVARQIAEGPGLERLRSDLRNSKAVTWLIEHVEVVDEQGNPMDRALLVEDEGSSDEPGSADAADTEETPAPESETEPEEGRA